MTNKDLLSDSPPQTFKERIKTPEFLSFYSRYVFPAAIVIALSLYAWSYTSVTFDPVFGTDSKLINLLFHDVSDAGDVYQNTLFGRYLFFFCLFFIGLAIIALCLLQRPFLPSPATKLLLPTCGILGAVGMTMVGLFHPDDIPLHLFPDSSLVQFLFHAIGAGTAFITLPIFMLWTIAIVRKAKEARGAPTTAIKRCLLTLAILVGADAVAYGTRNIILSQKPQEFIDICGVWSECISDPWLGFAFYEWILTLTLIGGLTACSILSHELGITEKYEPEERLPLIVVEQLA
eukprot:gnl/Dysnectes_brevis/9421_a17489_243.p1 GENE.gnl/Dysnectes_brevis/9421_a17489_243~~gnl/Dysnectes_brevis/9421_a17489_243.p1  ORF type:complete len:290 (+),score=26.98 gnl/Dysnectes_brevis/9421_a17489_243:41-910(+)